MADTIPDVILNGNEYQNLYFETGITSGTALKIQNKSIGKVQIVKSKTKPSIDTKGYILDSDVRFPLEIAAGENGVFALGKGPIHVEDNS